MGAQIIKLPRDSASLMIEIERIIIGNVDRYIHPVSNIDDGTAYKLQQMFCSMQHKKKKRHAHTHKGFAKTRPRNKFSALYQPKL
jgi:fumarylacetoacetate (FAA) hydrolase family protein